MTDCEKYLKQWFQEKTGSVPQFSENYFESGNIDSMGIMNLVMDVEKRFGMAFTHESFEDRRFPTIKGLAEMIEELKAQTST